MKAIIIDDEPLALRHMERLLHKVGVTVVGAYTDPLQAIASHAGLSEQPDLVFLDIEMPEADGLETAEKLLRLQPELRVVFVTAHNAYAVEAFELNALDYLLKPVQSSRLAKTLQRAAQPEQQREAAVSAGEENRIALRFFKSLHLHHPVQGSIPFQWRTTKAQELFAYLVHHRGRASVPKEEIIELLWPDYDMQKSSALLHTTIYQIRQTVKKMNFPITIQYIDGGFRILLGDIALDCEEWEKAIRAIPPVSDATIAEHEEVSALYAGDYLEDHPYLWAEREKERLKMIWLDHHKSIASYFLERGLHAKALQGYQVIQEKHPYLEDGYLGLMKLYDKLGLVEEVNKQYERYASLLREDLGIEPGERISGWREAWLASRKP